MMSLQTLFITDLKPLFPRGFISNKTDILIALACLLYPLSLKWFRMSREKRVPFLVHPQVTSRRTAITPYNN